MLLITEFGIDPNLRDSVLRTPIFYAASKDKADIVKYLISSGADVNARNSGNETPLMKAACFGSF